MVLSINNKKFIFLFLVLAVWLIFLATTFDNESENIEQTYSENKESKNYLPAINYAYGTWLWDVSSIGDTDFIACLLDFAKKKNIKTIYLRMDSYIDVKEAHGNISDFTKKIAFFLQSAKERSINVEALLGGNQLANDSNFYIIIDTLTFIFQNFAYDFVGVHLDIEPYQQDDFVGKEARYYQNYLKAISKVIEFLQETHYSNMKLSLDIPYWYASDKKTVNNIMYQQYKDNLFKHLITILEQYNNTQITIMAYRDRAKGANGAIAKAEQEIKVLSEQTSKIKVRIGQEFTEQRERNISYFNKNNTYIRQQLLLLDDYFAKHYSNYNGLDVHTLTQLLKKEAVCQR